MLADTDEYYEDTGGVGGTLPVNWLSMPAKREKLSTILPTDAYQQIIPLATRFWHSV